MTVNAAYRCTHGTVRTLVTITLDCWVHSVQTDVCDPALHIMGHFLMFPVLWKTIFWKNYA